jgi:hypothetical protein
MKTFSDNAGRTWVISINVSTIKRVRGLLDGFDLLSLVNDKFDGLGKLLSDPVKLVDVIYVICKDEADKLNITDEEFGRSMAGDAIEHATNAFMAELTDFFPDPRTRTGIRKVIETSQKVRDRLMDRMMENMENLDVNSVVSRLNGLSGNSRESSESTLDHSRFANF